MLGAFPAVLDGLSSWKGARWMTTGAGALTLLFILHASVQMRSGIDGRFHPVEACAFISATQLPGLFYNDYSFGGYWMWHFGTTRPVFIDGRLHTVDGYADLYRRIEKAQAGAPEGWETFLRSFGVDAALVAYPEKTIMPEIFRTYFPRARWALVYWDDSALIFLRRLPVYAPWIRQYEFSTMDPEAQPAYLLHRMQSSRLLAFQILKELKRNEQLHPDSQRVHQWLGFCQQWATR